jgi:hypothetical protein
VLAPSHVPKSYNPSGAHTLHMQEASMQLWASAPPSKHTKTICRIIPLPVVGCATLRASRAST